MIYAAFTLKPIGVGLENRASGLYVSDLAIPCVAHIVENYSATERFDLHMSLIYSLGQLLSSGTDSDLVVLHGQLQNILKQISEAEAPIEWVDGWAKTYTSDDGVVKLNYSLVGVTVCGEPLL